MNEEIEDRDRIICPVCDQVILDYYEGETDFCEHVMLVYTDALNGEFVHTNKSMKKVAKKMTDQYEDSDYEDSLDTLMKKYVEENEGYDIVELTTYGISCGPVSNTDFVMFKKV